MNCWANESAWKAHDWLKRSIALKLHRIICTQCIFVLSSLSAHWNSRWALSNSNAGNNSDDDDDEPYWWYQLWWFWWWCRWNHWLRDRVHWLEDRMDRSGQTHLMMRMRMIRRTGMMMMRMMMIRGMGMTDTLDDEDEGWRRSIDCVNRLFSELIWKC